MQQYSWDVFSNFWPEGSKVAFIWLPNEVMANALKTPKCIDFCLMMLEADCFDGERVGNGSDRNQNHLWFAIHFA